MEQNIGILFVVIGSLSASIGILEKNYMFGIDRSVDKFNKKYNVNIVAIKSNNGGKVNISPEPEYKFKDTDIVVLVGDIESINRLESI